MKTVVLFMIVGVLNGLVGGRSCRKPCASTEPRCPLGFRCQNERCIACPEGTTGPNYDCNVCSHGYPLADLFCGRGGSTCPQGYSCNIDPDDAFAVCCLASGEPGLDGNRKPINFGIGRTPCSPSYTFHVEPTDACAVCCPNV